MKQDLVMAVSFEGITWYLCKLHRWVGFNILTKINNNWRSKGQRSWVKGQISGFYATFCAISNSKSTRHTNPMLYHDTLVREFVSRRLWGQKVKGHKASDLF